MQEIKQIRKALGLSQLELAELLQVSKGLLAMAELGKRSLGYEANASLAALQRGLNAVNSDVDSEKTLLQNDKSRQYLHKLIRRNTHLLATYIDLQDKQMEQIKQKQRLIALGEEYETTLIWCEDSEAYDFFKLLKRKAEAELSVFIIEYIKLKIKIYGLQNEIELLNVLK